MTYLNSVRGRRESFPKNVAILSDLVKNNPDSKFAPYQYMANAIINLTHKNGDCLPEDLLALGFTQQETLDLWHMSYAMANVELKLLEKRGIPPYKALYA